MQKSLALLTLFFMSLFARAQTSEAPSIKDQYFEEQQVFARQIRNNIYSDFASFNAMDPIRFGSSIDSLESIFHAHLSEYSDRLDSSVIQDENIGIQYFFDKFLLEYPAHHQDYTGELVSLTPEKQARLTAHTADLNDAALLTNRDFREYVQALLAIDANQAIATGAYDKSDNQQLEAVWAGMDQRFTNPQVRDYWRGEYLMNHMDNYGVRNIGSIYDEFITTCQEEEAVSKARAAYEKFDSARASHLIETYKIVDGFELEMHLFLPDSQVFAGPRPTIIYFHGGSWSEGKPDWFFGEGAEFARQGWVAAAIEYRIKGRHGTLPFEAVKDAKSAVRWLRENAVKHKINPDKIIATGNSAGGHLVLATALVENWNEESDDLGVSAKPNALMVVSGVFDLTVDNSKWIVKTLNNKELVKEISPNHLIKEDLPPMLIIHGENDRNCLYSTAEYFVSQSERLNNKVTFSAIEGAGHFIWFGRYGGNVAAIQREYLNSLGFD